MTELKNKNIIKDEELNEVTGGYSGHVDKYHGVIGETYYFVWDKWPHSCIKGVLVKSYESRCLWWTERMHDVRVISAKGYAPGTVVTIGGDDHTMYLYDD